MSTEKRIWDAASGIGNLVKLCVLILVAGVTWGTLSAAQSNTKDKVETNAAKIESLGTSQNEIKTDVEITNVKLSTLSESFKEFKDDYDDDQKEARESQEKQSRLLERIVDELARDD